jgi:hypothetical protein
LPVKQEEFQPFCPDLNPRRNNFWLNYQSVCFLPGSLPPPTWRRTARRIKRLKEGVLTISPDYSNRPTPDFLALSYDKFEPLTRGSYVA